VSGDKATPTFALAPAALPRLILRARARAAVVRSLQCLGAPLVIVSLAGVTLFRATKESGEVQSSGASMWNLHA
jgi:hypothetical protein